MKEELVKLRAGLETTAYWAHGIYGAILFLMLVLEPEAIGLVILFFPIALPLTILTILSGFFSIQTAILSLLLIGILTEASNGPMINAYVLAWVLIIGYRIFRIVKDRDRQAR